MQDDFTNRGKDINIQEQQHNGKGKEGKEKQSRMKADNDQTMGVKIQKQRQNDNGQREKEQHLGKYPQPNLKKNQNYNYTSVVHVHENAMGSVDDHFGNLVQKDIANKLGNQKDHNQWKRDGDQGKTNKRMWGKIRRKTNILEILQKCLEILIKKILH